MSHTLALVSGKGGTGVTSLSIALGASLMNYGLDTTVIDANLSAPNIGLHLGTPNFPTAIQDALDDPAALRDAIYHHAPSGLKIIPGNLSLRFARQSNQDKLFNLPKLIEQISSPLVILDLPSGFHPEAMVGLESADAAIIVTTPELPAVMDALKMIRRSEELGVEVEGVIINRVGQHPNELAIENVEALLETEILAIIPNDMSVTEALAIKHPFTYSHPDSRASKAVQEMAKNMLYPNANDS